MRYPKYLAQALVVLFAILFSLTSNAGGKPNEGPPPSHDPHGDVPDTTVVGIGNSRASVGNVSSRSDADATAVSGSLSSAKGGNASATGGDAVAVGTGGAGGEGGRGGQGGTAVAQNSTTNVNESAVSGNSIGSNNSYEEAPQTAIAYATVCGGGIGAQTQDFGLSVTGETQYCKELRMAAMFEGLYNEAKARKDNTMSQLWYGSMVQHIQNADQQIAASEFTGRTKDTAQDLAWPVALCGGVAVVSSWNPAGWVCAGVLASKALYDMNDYNAKDKDSAIQTTILGTDFVGARANDAVSREEVQLMNSDLEGRVNEKMARQQADLATK